MITIKLSYDHISQQKDQKCKIFLGFTIISCDVVMGWVFCCCIMVVLSCVLMLYFLCVSVMRSYYFSFSLHVYARLSSRQNSPECLTFDIGWRPVRSWVRVWEEKDETGPHHSPLPYIDSGSGRGEDGILRSLPPARAPTFTPSIRPSPTPPTHSVGARLDIGQGGDNDNGGVNCSGGDFNLAGKVDRSFSVQFFSIKVKRIDT